MPVFHKNMPMPQSEIDPSSSAVPTPGEKDNIEPSDARSPTVRTPFYRGCQRVVNVFSRIALDFKAYGVEHVPTRGGVLIVSNHQSYLDPPLLGVPLPRPVAFLAKSELFAIKPFAWMIRSLNAFPVRQGKGDVGAMKESIRLLQSGWALTVFPEGSRSIGGKLLPVQKGAGLIVKRAGVPVVPAVIDGSYRAMPRGGGGLPTFTRVRVLYGKPEDLHDAKADEIRQWIDDRFSTLLRRLRSGDV